MDQTLVAAGAVVGTAAAAAYLNAKFYISKDLQVLLRGREGERNWRRAVARGEASGFYLFQRWAQEFGDHLCLWSRTGIYTWRECLERACQYGHFLLSVGVRPGDFVGVYLLNSPEIVFTWMGLLSIGAAPAMLNTNLSSDALVHCVKISNTKIMIVDSDPGCQERVEGSRAKVESELGLRIFVLDESLKTEIARQPAVQPDKTYIASLADKAMIAIIYTSGTTGLPKGVALPIIGLYKSQSCADKAYGRRRGPNGDRTYNCMPLYHGTGGLTLMSDMFSGTSAAIGKKFSLSNFWIDCIDSQATQFIYVGEVARYLLSAPPSPNDRKHGIKFMSGNGLQPDVWKRFQERFGIQELAEFYASTESAMFMNNYYRGGPGFGALGHHGGIHRYIFQNVYVPVRIDEESGDIWRDPHTGFAERKKYEDGGEILVKLPSDKGWSQYRNNQDASMKKIAQDVFERGDFYFRTGDAMRRDQEGFWYFMDRLGDNYRWKGENVSTTEVSQAFGEFPGIQEANVYGVTLPNHDGRAGCAALVVDSDLRDSFPWTALVQHLRSKLPNYAVPIFIRLMHIQVGGMSNASNKQNKVGLRTEGVDSGLYGTKVLSGELDTVFWLPPGRNTYIPFQPGDWQKISSRDVKL